MGATVLSFGCRLNHAESEGISAALADGGDLVVVNSCAVTAAASAEARRAIRRAARGGARVVVTGCASEVDRAGFEAMPEVAGVVANARKLDAALYRNLGESRDPGRDTRVEPTTDHASLSWISAFAGMTRGRARFTLPVQNGCDHRCTFCIIPYGRGPSRSLDPAQAIATARAAVANGAKEVVLTGVDLTAYGTDLAEMPSLGQLVEQILRAVPNLPRLRLSSLDPCEVDDRLIGLYANEPRLMPYAHLSLQAGDDLTLKRMKRRHSRADAIRLVERLKRARPGIAIGADLIAGFPTEDEAMFAGSLAILEECDIVLPHIFPFSPREGTPAARMPQVQPAAVRARAARLRAAAGIRTAGWLAGQVGSVLRVLVEMDGASGHAENFAKVRVKAPLPLRERGWGEGSAELARRGIEPPRPIPSPQPSPAGGQGVLPNTIVRTRITAVDGATLIGVPA